MELHWFGGQKHEAATGLSRNCSSLTAKQHRASLHLHGAAEKAEKGTVCGHH